MTKDEIEKIQKDIDEYLGDIISNEDDIIRTDFQGWPVFKKTLGSLLRELGARIVETPEGKIIGFKLDDNILKVYPTTLEDDGMGYGVNEKYIEEASYIEDANRINIFISTKES